jgi:hypothetical protein
VGDERSEEEVCVGNALGVEESEAWAAQDSLVSSHSPLNIALIGP